MQFEIYTTGGGFYLNDIFNYLAAYTSSANFGNLLWIGSMIGVMIVGWQLLFGGNFRDVAKHLVLVAVVGGACLGPRADVVIIDRTKGALPFYSVVSNVPYGIALVGSTTSGVSNYITKHMETLLSTPTNISYLQSGLMFGATIMSQAARFRAVSTILHENLVGFMDNCVVDAINLGHMDIDVVAGSGDLITTLDTDLPNSLSYYDTMTSTTTLCRTGWPVLKAYINAEVTNVLNHKAASLYESNPTSGPANVAKLTGTLGDFQTMMGMSSASATNTIRQSMLIHSMDDSISRFIANSGNAAAMGIYQSARANAQTRTSYATVGASALTWVPILKIVFETLLYAVFPIALLLLMTPLGLAVLKGYVGGFVWIAAWEPMSAILHFIVIKSASGQYRAAGFVTTDGSVSDVVLSWANHFGVQAVEQDVGAMAGYLMMSVPFLAYAILFGASRMMGLATSMLAVGQGAAMEAGREGASGNISLGNVNMSNFAANKWNTSSVLDQGRRSGNLKSGATITTNPDGSTSNAMGSALSQTGFSPTFNQGIRQELSQRAENARSAVAAQTAELGSYVSNSASTIADRARTAAASIASGTDFATNMSQEDRRGFSESWKSIEEFSEKHGLTTSVGMQAVFAGQLGAGAVRRIGARLAANGTLGGASTEDFAKAVQASKSADIQNALSVVTSTSEAVRATQSNTSGETASEAERWSLDKGQRLAEGLSRRTQEANALSSAVANLESQGVSANTALAQIAYQSLRDSGLSAAEASAIMNPKDFGSMNLAQPVMEELVDDISQAYALQTDMVDPREGFAVNPGFSPPVSPAPAKAPDLTAASLQNYDTGVAMHDENMRATTQGYHSGREAVEGAHKDQVASVEAGRDRNVATAAGARGADVLNDAAGGIASFGERTIDRLMGKGAQDAMAASGMTAQDRDLAIRTVLGEAGNQGMIGQMAVAHVIKNRVSDARWADTVTDVVTQPRAFSAWNADGSGNSIARNADPGSQAYRTAGAAVDAVFSGKIDDMTGGATHYYAPSGMDALVDQGYQRNRTPTWLAQEQAQRGDPDAVIGGHIFTGRVSE